MYINCWGYENYCKKNYFYMAVGNKYAWSWRSAVILSVESGWAFIELRRKDTIFIFSPLSVYT